MSNYASCELFTVRVKRLAHSPERRRLHGSNHFRTCAVETDGAVWRCAAVCACLSVCLSVCLCAIACDCVRLRAIACDCVRLRAIACDCVLCVWVPWRRKMMILFLDVFTTVI
jgi:hypothetical protein